MNVVAKHLRLVHAEKRLTDPLQDSEVVARLCLLGYSQRCFLYGGLSLLSAVTPNQPVMFRQVLL